MNIFAELAKGIETLDANGTQKVAAQLAEALGPDRTLALHGNLGVGKTTFVQGFAKALGVRDTVTSPTFNIFTLYRAETRTLVHLDAYRLDSPQSIDALMLEDFLVSPFWLAVEWPEKIAAWIPRDAVHLEMKIMSPGRHVVRLLQNGV